MKTTKEMRKEIKETVRGCPNHDICHDLHVMTVGYKYVTLWDMYNSRKIIEAIEDFYVAYCK